MSGHLLNRSVCDLAGPLRDTRGYTPPGPAEGGIAARSTRSRTTARRNTDSGPCGRPTRPPPVVGRSGGSVPAAARRRERDASPVTLEQRDSKRLLQFANVLADRGLGNQQCVRRAGETPALRHSAENLELAKIHGLATRLPCRGGVGTGDADTSTTESAVSAGARLPRGDGIELRSPRRPLTDPRRAATEGKTPNEPNIMA